MTQNDWFLWRLGHRKSRHVSICFLFLYPLTFYALHTNIRDFNSFTIFIKTQIIFDRSNCFGNSKRNFANFKNWNLILYFQIFTNLSLHFLVLSHALNPHYMREHCWIFWYLIANMTVFNAMGFFYLKNTQKGNFQDRKKFSYAFFWISTLLFGLF